MLSIKIPNHKIIRIPSFNENYLKFTLKNVHIYSFKKSKKGINEKIPFMSLDDPRHSQK